MGNKTIAIMVPDELFQRLEEAAKANYCSPSDYIRDAVVLRLNNQKIVSIQPNQEQTEDEFLKQLTERYRKS